MELNLKKKKATEIESLGEEIRTQTNTGKTIQELGEKRAMSPSQGGRSWETFPVTPRPGLAASCLLML